MPIIEKRCVICQKKFTTHTSRYILCGDRICAKRRHDEKKEVIYAEKRISRHIAKAKKLLEVNGYVILPKISNCRIIIEPIPEI